MTNLSFPKERLEMMHTSARADQLAALEDGTFDVLILGGGIVGAGVLYAAARQGLRAALVDKSDFAFGTSSRSTRLIHGGLRYLAQGRLGLVFEASQEKLRLSRAIPHLVQPLPFVFPSYRRSAWPLWQLWLGVKLYDALCLGRNFEPSRAAAPPELDRVAPGLRKEGLQGAVRYFDALTNDARLVIDTLKGASLRGGLAVNYVRFVEAKREGPSWTVELVDEISQKSLRTKARWIVNATGPWAENFPQSRIRLRLTKGIHLVVDQHRLPVQEAVVLAEGRRILFAIPWGRRVILGTTDTDYSGSLDEIPIDPQDVDYVLGIINHYFPPAKLGPADIRAAWAGLRPLVARGRGGPSDISRAHVIRISAPGWLDIAGGKLTTYLRMGEQAIGRILRQLGKQKRPLPPAEPILPSGEETFGVLPPETAETLVERMCTGEWACHLADVMVRRTSWHYWCDDIPELAETVSKWMAQVLGWSEEVRQSELAEYRKYCLTTYVAWPSMAATKAAVRRADDAGT